MLHQNLQGFTDKETEAPHTSKDAESVSCRRAEPPYWEFSNGALSSWAIVNTKALDKVHSEKSVSLFPDLPPQPGVLSEKPERQAAPPQEQDQIMSLL